MVLHANIRTALALLLCMSATASPTLHRPTDVSSVRPSSASSAGEGGPPARGAEGARDGLRDEASIAPPDDDEHRKRGRKLQRTRKSLFGRRQPSFAAFNTLLSYVTLKLPDAEVSQSGLELTLTELECENVSLQGIGIDHAVRSSTDQSVLLSVSGVSLECTLRWEYRWTIFSGKGSGYGRLDPKSSASVRMNFASEDYALHPPTDVTVTQCEPRLEIGEMKFDGDGVGIVGGIIDLFEGLLRGTIEAELEKLMCDELRGLGDEAMDKLLNRIDSVLEGYIEPSENESGSTALEKESTAVVPVNEDGEKVYLDFLRLDEYAGGWIDDALGAIDDFLGGEAAVAIAAVGEETPTSAIGTAMLDMFQSSAGTEALPRLGINEFIRDNLLDSAGALVLDTSLFTDDAEIFDGHDMLTETSLSIEEVSLKGLDSFTELDLLNAIGNYTLRNVLRLDHLTVQVNMRAVMAASSLSDAVIVGDAEPIVEHFSIEITLRDIEIDLSVFLGVNTVTLGSLQLGPLLHSSDVATCLLSAVDELEATELLVSVGDVEPPTLTGFLDSGVDYIITSAAGSLFKMYEAVALRALPNFFDSFVKDRLNAYVDDTLRLFSSGCELSSDMEALDGHVDFRDLLYGAEEAASAGGNGDGRYGDLVPMVMDVIDDWLFGWDEDTGLLAINEAVIVPLTESRFGQRGAVVLEGDLVDLEHFSRYDLWKSFATDLRLTLSNLRVNGLDTLRTPFKVLEPSASGPHVVENQLNLGPMSAGFEFGIGIGDETSPLAMANVVDIMFIMPEVELFVDLFATLQESRLMQFPLRDVLNGSCWLATLPQSDGHLTGTTAGLSLDYLELLFDQGMQITTSCITCTNQWLDDLDRIIGFLSEHNFVDEVKSRALAIASDLANSPWVGGLIDEQIAKASRACPHDPQFGLSLPETSLPGFVATRDIVDGILFTGMTVVQVIAIIMAQRHSELEVPEKPLEIELIVPDDSNLIDLTNLSAIVGFADVALDEGRKYVGSAAENGELGINNLLSMLLDEDGVLTIPLEEEANGFPGFEAGGVKLEVWEVQLVGMDSFTTFDVFQTIDSYTLKNKIALERLGCRVKMGLSVEDSTGEQARMLQESGVDANSLETITASLVFKDVELDISLLMAMDRYLLGSMKLGSILNTDNIFYCLLSAVHDVGLSEFIMDVGDIQEFAIEGFVSNATEASIRGMTNSIFDEYKSMVLDALPAFTAVTVRPILHDILGTLVERGRTGACPDPDPALDGLVDFRDLFLPVETARMMVGADGDSPYGDLLRMAYGFLDGMMSESDDSGMSDMNSLVASLTERQSGKTGDIHFLGKLFGRDLDIDFNGLNAVISLAISDVKVSNLDSLGSPIELLGPVIDMPNMLNNTASIGVGPEPLRVSFRLLIRGKGDEVEVDNDLVLGFSVNHMRMIAEVLLQIEELSFLNFPLGDVLNIDCWLATIVTPVLNKYGLRDSESATGIVLRNLAMAVAEARLDIDCILCTSPLLLELADYFSSPQGVEDTTTVANDIFAYISRLLGGNFIQNQLDKVLAEAQMKCPHSPSYQQNFAGLQFQAMETVEEPESLYGFLVAIAVVVGMLLVVISVLVLVTRFVSRRRHVRWCKTLSRAQLKELAKIERDEATKAKDLNTRVTSLVRSKEVPLIVRLLMPLVILANIGLFLSGHLSLGGTVNISGSFAGQDFDIDGFFEFSMLKSTIEMWQAGAHELAILIALFSGLWPYTKQILTLIIWLSPTKYLSCQRRERMLIWLDCLGKWSMVDVFVLLMTLASFALSIESPEHLNFLPQGLYSINMLVVPLWGLYANMLAQFLAQISSHFIIHYHRKSVKAAEVEQCEEMGLDPPRNPDSRERLHQHSFRLDYEASNERAELRRGTNWTLVASFILFTLLVIVGCSIPSFSIETLGLVGLAIESGNRNWSEAYTSYSVFGLARTIMDQGRFLGTASAHVGMGTLAALLVVTAFLVPLFQAASLFASWFAPLSRKRRRKNEVLNEILSAWQYMEVYVLSIMIAAWQLGGVSEYMINEYCGSLDNTFSSLSYYGILDKEDAQCFRVNAGVETGTWLLVAASIILYFINSFVSLSAKQKAVDDDVPAENRFTSDRWLHTKGSTLTVGISYSMEEDGGDELASEGSTVVSPVRPRFTDYFALAVVRKVEVISEIEQVETAVPPEEAWEGHKN